MGVQNLKNQFFKNAERPIDDTNKIAIGDQNYFVWNQEKCCILLSTWGQMLQMQLKASQVHVWCKQAVFLKI